MKILTVIAMAAACSLSLARGTSPTVDLQAKPEHSVLHQSGGDSVIQVEIRGRNEPAARRKIPLNLAIVLDRSGSMSGQKIDQARQAAAVALDQIGPDDTFSLVAYSSGVEIIIPAGPVTNRADLVKKIHSIEASGNTALHAGVVAGAAELRKFFAKEKINRVILLSDGQANSGPSSPDDLAALGSKLSGDGISVTTIGLGDGYNEDLMTRLAEASEANYYYVKDAEKLPGVFDEELGTVRSIVARDLRLIITLPEGVQGTGLLGEEEISFQGRTLTIPLSEFSSGQTRRFLVGVKVPPGTGSDVHLAGVQLAYFDTAGRNQSTEVTVRAGRSADAKTVTASMIPEVATETAVVRNRLAKEKAVRLADAGRPDEAAGLLRSQAAVNAALPGAVQSDLLRRENASLAQRAAELESGRALSAASRKEILFENYQDKKQKR